MTTTETAETLERGEAFVELADADVTRVSGGDARGWLNDLVTTDVASLGRGEARSSLLLTPTGRIRAQFEVAAVDADAFLLIQREPFETPVATALAPYVLSSDVVLEPTDLVVVAIPGDGRLPAAPGDATVLAAVPGDVTSLAPSILGGGSDLVVEPTSLERVRTALTAGGLEPATPADAEARRIRRGEPRFGFDLDAESLPAEAGLDVGPVTDRTKGCFLGQESVARVANLGHPNRVLVAVRADGPIAAGDDVLDAGDRVGAITSADGVHGIVRVSWGARDRALETAAGVALDRFRAS